MVPLLEEEDVRDHICPGIGSEGVVGQTDGSQQLRTLGQIPAHGLVLAVHGIAAGEEGHNPAGPNLVQRLGEEVVVDAEAQLVVPLVVDPVLPKGDVANGRVKEAVREVGLLEAPD